MRALAAPFAAALPPPDAADMTLLITIDPVACERLRLLR